MSDKKLKKISITIEEDGTANGKGFKVYMEGDKEEIKGKKEDELSPAEFWASKLFMICAHALKQSGAAQSETKGDTNASHEV